ncbi:MAG: DNA polymerase domain-containing protein, partial [Alicyclobacillus sp. RIFOXYA1_FULL_53_8]
MELVAEHPVTITNPDKLLWPEANITKAGYIQYMIEVSPWLLPYLRDRPLTLIRYPHGVHGHSFYQKNCPTYAPDWIRRVPVWSDERKDVIQYVVADSLASLIWLANQACLEFHVGFTTLVRPTQPDSVAFDLDPTVAGFEPVREVALALHGLLDRLNLPHLPKTSGATGLQVFIPLQSGHTFEQTRIFTKAVAVYLERQLPNLVTLERLTKNRGTKVYIDFPQHGASRTLIAPYSCRATKLATVSTPLLWSELAAGALPEQFTITTVPPRLRKQGDCMAASNDLASLREIVRFLD